MFFSFLLLKSTSNGREHKRRAKRWSVYCYFNIFPCLHTHSLCIRMKWELKCHFAQASATVECLGDVTVSMCACKKVQTTISSSVCVCACARFGMRWEEWKTEKKNITSECDSKREREQEPRTLAENSYIIAVVIISIIIINNIDMHDAITIVSQNVVGQLRAWMCARTELSELSTAVTTNPIIL